MWREEDHTSARTMLLSRTSALRRVATDTLSDQVANPYDQRAVKKDAPEDGSWIKALNFSLGTVTKSITAKILISLP